jgi:hypothetical protein
LFLWVRSLRGLLKLAICVWYCSLIPVCGTSHCKNVLKRCRSMFYCFRNYYRKYSPDSACQGIIRQTLLLTASWI